MPKRENFRTSRIMGTKSDITTIEELRKIGKDVQAIGNGTYKWPILECKHFGDLTIVEIRYPNE